MPASTKWGWCDCNDVQLHVHAFRTSTCGRRMREIRTSGGTRETQPPAVALAYSTGSPTLDRI